ncbi:MAG: hypothetical protein ACHQFX_05425 [Chitinophagales bacterium]
MSYSRILIRLSFICFLGTIVVPPSEAQSKTLLITAIRKDFQAINADKTLSKKTLTDEEFMENATDGGGELTGYYKKDSLVKIIEWIGLSFGNRTREFYLKNAKLFFVYEKFESFVVKDSTVAEIDHSKVTTTFEGRYYFNKDKLIEQKNSGKQSFEETPAAVMVELLNAAKENIRLLNKQVKQPG